MALSDKKIVSYEVSIKDLSDTPSADGVSADQLKAMFDARTDDEDVYKRQINDHGHRNIGLLHIAGLQ